MPSICRFAMRSGQAKCAVTLACLAGAFVLAVPQPAAAQLSNVGGVYVDPQGMLRETSGLRGDELREALLAAAENAQPSLDVAAKSPLRKVSLRRLENTVARLNRPDESIPADIQFLAGLTAIKYVFFYPDEDDVVLAGPAEGWESLETGDVIGRQSRRPVLQLDDLVVVLRYAFQKQPEGSFLGCSIEPTEQGLKTHAAFVRRLAGFEHNQLAQVIQGMEQAMGPQDILVYGVPSSTRLALEMIAADYRLKRLALAHDPSPSNKVPSYLDLAERSLTGGPQRQHRWWFVGHFDAIRHTADRLAFEFEGTGLKVDTAPTKTGAGGDPKPTRAAKQFCELATRNMPELIEKVPVFAELQNLVALAVVAEIIRRADTMTDESTVDGAAVADSEREPAAAAHSPRPWRPVHFLDEGACPIASLETPKQTASLANARFVKNQFWLFTTSGGVEIDPRRLADEKHLKPADSPKLIQTRDASRAPAKAAWWWD